MAKKFLTIKYKGEKHFESYGDIVAGEIGVDKYRMFVFNTDYFEKSPELKEAYEKVSKILAETMKDEDF